jgi:hypothetical protein
MADSPANERPRFFPGKLLTTEDLAQEQHYVREKQKLHNRTLHGFGVVSGLKVSTQSGEIVISPGYALDCEGNEIVIEAPQTLCPPAQSGSGVYLSVRFTEECIKPVTTASGAEASSIKDSFELLVTADNCNARHRHARGRWLACGQPHALTLARLRPNAQGWRVDRSYRVPSVK